MRNLRKILLCLQNYINCDKRRKVWFLSHHVSILCTSHSKQPKEEGCEVSIPQGAFSKAEREIQWQRLCLKYVQLRRLQIISENSSSKLNLETFLWF